MNKKITRIHFMGIGGSGISAVAQIANAQGFEVSGCDLETSRITHTLEKAGIPTSIGHDQSHLNKIDLLVHTPAVFYQSLEHPEYTLAKKKGIAMIWEEFMAKFLMKGKFVIAVAGTHGKGTTTGMLARILDVDGLDPTVEVGANLLDWNRQNFRIGQSKYFLCEADEFRDKFLLYKPNLIIITSIEMDHPEYFKNVDQIINSFKKLVLQMKEPSILVINGKDAGCLRLIKILKELKWKGKIITYDPEFKFKFKFKIPGKHVRADAMAASIAANSIGVDQPAINRALEGFGGLERRFEYKGETNEGAKVYDDYAHHPTAVRVNIEAARELYPKKKVWVVFQPHMHTRLEKLFDEFVESLQLADRVIIPDVFTRRESGITKPSGKDLAIAVGSPKATYVGGDTVSVSNFVNRNSKKSDVIIVMGAGDSYKIAEELVK